ncbi:hypothetical protein DFH06DRAFT_1174596, partial [Mycena polygramma]
MPPESIFRTFEPYQSAFLARALAFSRTLNTRNLEAHWYITWNHHLMTVVGGLTHFLVAPQYPLWCVAAEHPSDEEPGEDDDEDKGENMSVDDDADDSAADEHVVEPPMEPLEFDDYDEWDGTGPGDLSTDSDGTVAQPKATTQITDFAIVQVTNSPNTDTSSHSSSLGKIFTALIGRLNISADMKAVLGSRRADMPLQNQFPRVLVEIKRFPHRNYVGEQFMQALRVLLTEARTQLLRQAAVLFCMEEAQATAVVLIAAAGPYYITANIRRKKTAPSLHSATIRNAIEGKKLGPLLEALITPTWTVPMYLGSTPSNQRLATLRKNLRQWDTFEKNIL